MIFQRLNISCYALIIRWLSVFSMFFAFATSRATDSTPAQRAERAFYSQRIEYSKNPQDVTNAWRFGRASFDWAEFATSNSQRASIAQEGILACRQAVATEPRNSHANYYLAMNLGQMARTKKLGALSIVDEMELVFTLVTKVEPKLDYGGPERCLGLLYFEAPGWPTSIGSRSKARIHLRRAVELVPDYPDNQLSLMEAYVHWGEKNLAKEQAKAFAQLLPKARQTFVGEDWELSWQDWDRRWKELRKKLGIQL